ncbi:MAG: hypothetical protein MZU97_05350 [Bacillus subtilis]|nr:hypothetical protein [Bacillus subtilis]
MANLLTSQAFGVLVATGAYLFGAFLYRKTKFPFVYADSRRHFGHHLVS